MLQSMICFDLSQIFWPNFSGDPAQQVVLRLKTQKSQNVYDHVQKL